MVPNATMPFTPFHFGPGLAAKVVADRWFSLSAFVLVQVAIDVETLYNILRRTYPLHAFFHTLVGAVSAGVGVALLMMAALRSFPPRKGQPDATRFVRRPFLQGELSNVGIVVGSLVGGTSHSILDSVMHPDMAPFMPFSSANPLLRVIDVQTLHAGCLGAGLFGCAALVIWWTRRDPTA